MPYPLVSTRRQMADPREGSAAIMSGADLLSGHLEQRRQEGREADLLRDERAFQTGLRHLQSRLEMDQDRFRHELNAPYLETPEMRHQRAAQLAVLGSDLNLREYAANYGIGQADRDRDFNLRRDLGWAGVNIDRDRLGIERTRENRLSQGTGGSSGLSDAIIRDLMGGSQGPAALLDPYSPQSQIFRSLHNYRSGGGLMYDHDPAMGVQTGEYSTPFRFPGVFAQPGATRQGAPVPGSGPGPGLLGGGRGGPPAAGGAAMLGGNPEMMTGASGEFIGGIRPDSPVNALSDEEIRGMSAADHAGLLMNPSFNADPREYIARLEQVDPMLAAEVEALLGGG